MHVRSVSEHVTKLHNVNFDALSIHTTEKHLLTRLSSQEKDLAVWLIKSDVTQADVKAIIFIIYMFI